MPRAGYHKSVIRYKVEQILSPEHLREYEALLRDPRTTVMKAHTWLAERGYKVGYAAVGRHRRRFDRDVQSVRKTAMLAEHFAHASKTGGLAAISDATLARFQQVLLERLMTLDGDDPKARSTRDFSSREWLEMSKAIGETVSARRNLEALRNEFDERARKAAEAVEGEAGKRKSFDGVRLANTVRRILGVPLPGEPIPGLPGSYPMPRVVAPDVEPDVPQDDPMVKRMNDALEEFGTPGDN